MQRFGSQSPSPSAWHADDTRTRRSMDGSFIRIQGIVIPSGWDSAGNVTGLALCAAGEEEYLILNDENGQKLRNFLQETVEISGRLQESHGPVRRIAVLQFCSTKPSPGSLGKISVGF
jgi:hypothetical protein